MSINTTIDACINAAHQAIETNLEDENGNEVGLFKDVTNALTALKITDEPEIKQGSVVKLNSGGKPMTVNMVSNNIAEIVWFDGETSQYKTDRFNVNMLRVLPTRRSTDDPDVRKYLTDAIKRFENDPADSAHQVGYLCALVDTHNDCFLTQQERAERAKAGTLGQLGQTAPLVPVSQNNSQSPECVGPDFGTTEVGTSAVGTDRIIGWPRIIGWFALGAVLLVAGTILIAKPHAWPSSSPDALPYCPPDPKECG
jgi:uncharacterized protein YodC (DUF2158 family)